MAAARGWLKVKKRAVVAAVFGLGKKGTTVGLLGEGDGGRRRTDLDL